MTLNLNTDIRFKFLFTSFLFLVCCILSENIFYGSISNRSHFAGASGSVLCLLCDSFTVIDSLYIFIWVTFSLCHVNFSMLYLGWSPPTPILMFFLNLFTFIYTNTSSLSFFLSLFPAIREFAFILGVIKDCRSVPCNHGVILHSTFYSSNIQHQPQKEVLWVKQKHRLHITSEEVADSSNMIWTQSMDSQIHRFLLP